MPERRRGLLEHDLEIEHVGVELDEACQVGGEHGDVVDAGEQAGVGSFGGFVVEQGVDGGGDSGGRLVAVEVPEVTQRPPHGGGAQHLDDGGEVARGSGTELGSGCRRVC